MRASNETYQKVAEYCSSYEAKCCKNGTTNSASEGGASCLNCKHFDKEQYCRLDLYDKIVKNHEIG